MINQRGHSGRRDKACPGCVDTRRTVEFFGGAAMLPHAWTPKKHDDDCPAGKPIKVFGVDVWTYAEDRT